MKRGDIVTLGRNRLMCGDAFSDQDVDALMHGQKPDMLYCDPPYGMRLDAKFSHMRPYGLTVPTYGVKTGHDYPDVIGDNADFDPTALMARFRATDEQFWWGADYYTLGLPAGGSWVVWDKRLEERLDRMFGSCFELCWSRKRHKRSIARVQWAGLWGLAAEPERRRLHPTQKPIALAEWFLERYSKPEAAVADLFAGSGSTLLACERLNRRAFCMEISPDYCQIIIDRYHTMTKQPALIGAAS